VIRKPRAMASVTWPAALLLAVLVVCTTALSWKGLVPVHAFFTVAGLLLGYLIPKNGNPFSSRGLDKAKEIEIMAENMKRDRDMFALMAENMKRDRDMFAREESPTRKTLPDVPAAKKEE
jgi:hypothetical protein